MTLQRQKYGMARQKGLTIIELLVSIAIASIIMFAIGSSMVITTKAMPDVGGPANAVITTSEVAEQLANELQYAISINNHSASMVEFTVADRDGFATPETIRYEWSGVPGAPLTRRYNSGSVVEVLNAVQQFNLSYDLDNISKAAMPQYESAETLLIGYSSTQNLADYQLRPTQWYGQYFRPTLPADAVSWKVTRIEFFAKVDGQPTGDWRVQLQSPTAGNLPSGNVLEQKRFLEETVNENMYLRQQFTFSDMSGLSPQQGLCLVLKPISGSYPGLLWGQNGGVSTPNSYLVRSYDSGSSWSARTNESLLFSVYGTVTTSGQPTIQNTYYVKTVRIKIRTGADEQSIVYAGVTCLNKPEVKQ
jgi:prepilin-type N-terminal cleavage/methylation domain-containing protein